MRGSMRGRIALRATLACTVVFVVLAAYGYHRQLRQLVGRAGDRLDAFGKFERARCESDPAWGGQINGVEVWAYGDDGVSRNPRAPALSGEIRDQLAAGQPRALADGMLAVRMPWGGPCAIVAWRRTDATSVDIPSLGGAIGRAAVAALLVALLIAFVVYPLVRAELAAKDRQRRALETTVRHSAHDVGTPLAILFGQLEEIEARADRGESIASAVAAARDEVHLLAGVIGNLGTLARAGDGGAWERRVLDLRDPIERVASARIRFAEARAIDLEIAVPCDPVAVAIEPVSFQQALGNLVDNAIKYGRAGGYVAVTLEIDEARFRLRVIDDGGLADDDLEAARHGRRGTAGRELRPAGSGLGLAIVRTVADAHGFALELARSSDGGLEVTLTGELARASDELQVRALASQS